MVQILPSLENGGLCFPDEHRVGGVWKREVVKLSDSRRA